MKKTFNNSFIFFAIGITTLFMSGCSVQELLESKSKEDKIMEFANSYVEYRNTTGGIVDKVSNRISTWSSDVNSSGFPNLAGCWISKPHFIFSSPTINKESLEENMKNIPEGINEEDKKILQSEEFKLYKKYNVIHEECILLHKYLNADEYKVDKLKKGNEHVEKIVKYVDEYYDSAEKTMTIIKKIQKENDPNKNSQEPIHIAIRNMEEVIDAADLLTNNLNKLSETKEINKVKKSLEDLELLIKKHKENKPSFKNYKMGPALSVEYDLFFTTSEDRFIVEVKKAVNNYKTGNINKYNTTLGFVTSGYNSIIKVFNRFVAK